MLSMKTLKAKTIVLILGMVLATVLLVTLASYLTFTDVLHKSLQANFKALDRNINGAIGAEISEILEQQQSLSRQTVLSNALADSATRTIGIEPFLKETGRIAGVDIHIALTDYKGEVLSQNTKLEIAYPRKVILKAIEEAKVNAVWTEIDGRPHLFLAEPVLFRNTGLPEGALVFAIDLADLLRARTVFNILISHPSLGQVSMSVIDDKGQFWRAVLKEDGVVVALIKSQPASANDRPENIEFNSDLKIEGLGIIGAIQLAISSDWIDDQTKELRTKYALISLIVFVLAFPIGAYLSKKLSDRLSKIASNARSMLHQDTFTHRFKDDGADEVGDLGRAFNELLDDLDESRTGLKRAYERERDDHEAQYALVIDQARDGFVTTTPAGQIISVNAAFKSLFCGTSASCLGNSIQELFTKPEISKKIESISENLTTLDAYDFDLEYNDHLGAHTFAVSINPLTLQGENRYLWVFRDDTARADERHKIVDHAPLPMIVLDGDTRIKRVNGAFQDLFQIDHHQDLNFTEWFSSVILDEDNKAPLSVAQKISTESNYVEVSVKNPAKGMAVFGVKSVVLSDVIILTFIDVTNDRIKEKTLHDAAYIDQLTGLANRAAFVKNLDKRLTHHSRRDEDLAVLFIDLDHFKQVNDTQGHPIGDELLKLVALRMNEITRDQDLVARFGGDEFAILLAGIGGAEEAALVADKIIRQMHEPFAIGELSLYIGASVGVFIIDTKAEGTGDTEHVMENADIALYAAKEAGRNCFRFHTLEMSETVSQKVKIAQDLRRALASDEMIVFYQPQVNLATGMMVGVEALVRWQGQDGSIILPGVFIPVAEEHGMIEEIGSIVLNKVLEQINRWDSAGHYIPRVAINIAAQQFINPSFPNSIAAKISEHNLSAERIEIELTETALMRDLDMAANQVKRLSDLGISIAIDDFGTGHSSLAYLHKLPVDRLKIAQEFMRDIISDEADVEVVRAAVNIGLSFGMEVLIEGVETQAQLNAIKDLACHEVQGFFYSRPLPPELLERHFDGLDGNIPAKERAALGARLRLAKYQAS